jgi:hypothetical protein
MAREDALAAEMPETGPKTGPKTGSEGERQ